MRILGCIILFLIVGGFSKPTDDYLLISSRKFMVEGSTSLGNFTCNCDFMTQDTLFFNESSELSYKILVKEFGCGNFMLNRDFRKTLKEREYPEVIITLSDVKQRENKYSCTLNLFLAGRKKSFKNLVLHKEGKNLKGVLSLQISDFGLVAPKKLGGTIKIEDQIKLSILLKT